MADDSQSGTDSTESPQPCVRFSPGLSDQRQIFLLDVLRKHNPESILDIGCGEGSLLEAVCRPSFALPISRGFDERHGIKSDASIKCAEDTCDSIHAVRIAGLDVSDGVLSRASEGIQAIDEDFSHLGEWWRPRPRWSTLDVKLWKGGLQVFNPEFRDYDIILSSEVIEHLPEDILDCFCPMILGRYAPKILAITTPGYEFNQLFTAPGPPSDNTSSTPVVREGAYLDPTGRTQRCFRHHDHKFEWTRSEFHEWCTSNASLWGYSAVISGVGRSTVRDPWGRDEPGSGGEINMFASQTAIFMRMLQGVDEHRNQHESKAITLIHNVLSRREEEHLLFSHHKLDAHPGITSDQPPLSTQEVLEVVKATITESCSPSSPGEIEIWDLWNTDAVSLACRGSLERLYAVLEAGVDDGPNPLESGNASGNRADIEWEWIDPTNRTRWTRRIRWNTYKPSKDSNNPWEAGGKRDPMANGDYQSGCGGSDCGSLQDEVPSWDEKEVDSNADQDTIDNQWDNAGWGPSTGGIEGQNDQKGWGVSLTQQENGWGLQE